MIVEFKRCFSDDLEIVLESRDKKSLYEALIDQLRAELVEHNSLWNSFVFEPTIQVDGDVYRIVGKIQDSKFEEKVRFGGSFVEDFCKELQKCYDEGAAGSFKIIEETIITWDDLLSFNPNKFSKHFGIIKQ